MGETPFAGEGLALVLGLGNPGSNYEATRHNLGYMVVEELCRRHAIALKRGGLRTRKLKALWGRGQIAGRPVIVAKPLTYMNLSGEAAAGVLAYFGLDPGQMIVVHDDLDLAPGRIKVAVRGGAAGHRGMLSVQSLLGTDRFVRVKVGIGRPRFQEAMEEYVLNEFYPDQHDIFKQVVTAAADCVEMILGRGPQAAMERFHLLNKQTAEGEGSCKN